MKICIFLTFSNVDFSPKIKIRYLQNEQNCRFISPKIAKLISRKVRDSQSKNCKLACPGLYDDTLATKFIANSNSV